MKGSSRVAGAAVCAALSVMLLSGVTASAARAQAPTQPPRGPGPQALQLLVVPAFVSTDKTLGCTAANEVRDRLDGDVDTKKDWIIQKDNIDETLKASGFPPCTPISATDDKQLTQQLRGVAYIDGTVDKTATGIRVAPKIVLARDVSEVQPLPPVEALKIGDVAKQVSKEVLAAMKQYDGEEKCIDAARQQNYPAAIAAAQSAITAYPQASLARLCIANTLVAMKAPPDSIINESEAILKDDPHNQRALELAAQAYYDKKDFTNAVRAWGGLIASDPANTQRVEDIVTKIVQSGQASAAVPIVAQAMKDNPDDPKLSTLYCRILLAAKQNKDAPAACEAAIKTDTAFADTLYFQRVWAAYMADSQPQKAAQTTSQGLAKFKDNPTLLSLNANALAASGQTQQAIDALKKVVQVSPKNTDAWGQLYNDYINAQQYDSALATAHSAVANGVAPTTEGPFILTQANAFFKKAQTNKPRDTLQMAINWAKYSDSLAPAPPPKFIAGVSEFYIGLGLDQDATKSKSCDGVKQAESSWQDAQVDVHAGGSVSPPAAAQILETVQKYLPALAQQEKVFCKTGGATKKKG